MSDLFELETGADKSYSEDLKLFRIGAFKAWAEFGTIEGKVPLVSVNLAFADSGLPTARIDVPAGEPFGAFRQDTEYADYVYSDIQKFDRVELYLEIPEIDTSASDLVGPALPPGKYRMFVGLVSNIAKTIDRESGVYVARLTLAHEAATALSTGTLLFGPLAPYTHTHMYSRDNTQDDAVTKEEGRSEDSVVVDGFKENGNDLWSDRVAPAFKAYYKPTKFENPTEEKLRIFEKFATEAFKRMTAAVDSIEGTLPIRSSENDGLRYNIHTAADKNILVPGKIDTTSALTVLLELSDAYSFSVLCRPAGIIVLPYWPYRKLKEMKVLRAGVAVSVEDIRSLMTTRGSVVGGIVLLSPLGPEDQDNAALNGSDVVAAYALKLSDLASAYVTVDQETLPEYFLDTRANTDEDEPVLVKSTSDPGGGDTDSVAEGYARPVDEGLADEYARFRTWEHWLSGNVMEAAMPLRFDITPGLVVRIDNRITYEDEKLKPEDASYAYVKGVSVSISGASNAAGMAVTFTHLHTYDEQKILEDADVKPVLYDESALKVLDDLQLFDKV